MSGLRNDCYAIKIDSEMISNFVFFCLPGCSFSFLSQPSLDLWKEESHIEPINNPLDLRQVGRTLLCGSDWQSRAVACDINGTLVIST